MIKTLKNLGPGLLYAAAAIGVSHLVQSTRAGANYGNILIWAVIIANVLKYPFFRIGPEYTSITGESILKGYRRLGNWAIILFYIMTFLTMFTVQAAVTVVTAGIASQIFHLSLSVPIISLILLIVCGSILIIGHYDFLDKLIKIIIIILTITTIFAVAVSLGGDFPKQGAPTLFSLNDKSHIFFLIALVGWMPAPLDLPIWHSMWTIAKQKNTTHKINVKETVLDFNIGFIGTTLLAVCFLMLGSIVLYDSGIEFSSSASVFAGQLIKMYTSAIGDWAYPIIAVCAFSTMFSTTLTCLDAFPRILREAYSITLPKHHSESNNVYRSFLALTILGTSIILFFFMTNMKTLVDFATTLSFTVAPIYAYLNFKIMHLEHIPSEYHPQGKLKLLSLVGISFLSLFCLYFLVVKFII